MPRLRRDDGPGRYHHVMVRGVAQCAIFHDDFDRGRFHALAARHIRAGDARALAFALMGNHAHFVIQTGRIPLEDVIHGFAGPYAQYFNWRHSRVGHLFQNRYKAKPIATDAYLLNAIVYVHLNPVKDGVISGLERLATYRWSGHAALLGNREDAVLDPFDTLALFGDDVGEARAALRELMAARLRTWEDDPDWTWDAEPEEPRKTGQMIQAAARMRERSDALEAVRREREAGRLRQSRLRAEGWTIDAILAGVCVRFGVDVRDVLTASKVRPIAAARAVVAHLARDELGISCAAISRYLGLDESSVRDAVVRGREIARAIGVAVGSGPLAVPPGR